MSNKLEMTVGDTAPLPVFTLYDSCGIADLSSGDTARFIQIKTSSLDFVSCLDVTFVSGSSTAGQVTIAAWTTDANASSGDMWGEIEVVWQDATRTTFPTNTKIPITWHGEASTSS